MLLLLRSQKLLLLLGRCGGFCSVDLSDGVDGLKSLLAVARAVVKNVVDLKLKKNCRLKLSVKNGGDLNNKHRNNGND